MSANTNLQYNTESSSQYLSDESPSDIQENTDLATPPCLAEKYSYLREIGHGAQGKIYQAKRLADGALVAIKQLNIDSVQNWKKYDLFRREATVLESLNIDGVAKFYEAIERSDDIPPRSYIVQEYIQGKTLADMIRAGHRFSLVRVYDILIQLLKILKQLHAHVPPVIHRDIKPSNILLKPLKEDDFKVYLIDFGAVANPQVQGGGSTVAGTYGFMPPEQLMGKPSPASDIYSLAAVAVNLISGKSPAEMPVKDFRLIFEPDMQSMPPTLVNTLRAMLDPNTENRLSDIDKLIQTFTKFQHNQYSDEIRKQPADLTPKEYNRLLEQVDSVCQPGNIELWQRLSDKTPRIIPKCYAAIKLIPKDKPAPVPFGYSKRSQLYDINTGKLIQFEINPGMLLGCFAFCIIFPILLYTWAPFNQALNCFIGLLIGLFISRKYTKFYFNSLHSSKNYIRISNALADQLSTDKKERIEQLKAMAADQDYYNKLQDRPFLRKTATEADLIRLLGKGRKTIATITEIKYIPAYRKFIKYIKPKYQYFDPINYEIYSRPMFEISYKFNPPDDEKAEDLIHSFVTPVAPDQHYKAGDPLPILYMIHPRTNECPETVNSMPFPIPLHDIMDLSDVIYMDG
ncbi:MAG: serine/threonine protein kinase [Proteobacteria bacterium]|nr:serine/threonine protein kinase [Pseudomonadota bacterium]